MEASQVLVARSIEDPCECFRPLSRALAALTALHQAAKFEQLRAEDCALSPDDLLDEPAETAVPVEPAQAAEAAEAEVLRRPATVEFLVASPARVGLRLCYG